MIAEKIICNRCRTEKGVPNHWWIMELHGSHGPWISITPFSEADTEEIQRGEHLCSRECVHKTVELWLNQMEGR